DPVAQATVTDRQAGVQQQITYQAAQTATLFADRVVFQQTDQTDPLLTALVKPMAQIFTT
ncbi:hypothetical protein HMPREF0495_01609, partial [Levilactobacillus brevis ATCC 14869 = DSM 20054]